MSSFFNIDFMPCPQRQRVVNLLRPPVNSRLRAFHNYDALANALKRNGVFSYENVTIDQATARQQIQLFQNFSLIISPHSSALRSLIFSHRNSAVVEVSGGGYRRDVLSIGMDVGGIIYVYSNGHLNVQPCFSDPRRSTVDCDIHLNETLLFRTFQEVMGRQGASCPHLATRTSS
jgi:capsular polysaccharide biosynthesis protein